MEESPFVTIDEVAKYFVVSTSTVRSWVRTGLIPCLKVSNVYRFRLPDVEAALIEHSKTRRSKPQASTTDSTDM